MTPMPNARPTPGPWRIGDRRANGEVLIHADRQIVASVIQGHQDYTAEANARLIAAAVNAVFRFAAHLGRDPLEVAEGLDLVTMMRQRDEARREAERLRAKVERLRAINGGAG